MCHLNLILQCRVQCAMAICDLCAFFDFRAAHLQATDSHSRGQSWISTGAEAKMPIMQMRALQSAARPNTQNRICQEAKRMHCDKRRNWNLTLCSRSAAEREQELTDIEFLIVRRSIQFARIGVQEIALYLFTLTECAPPISRYWTGRWRSAGRNQSKRCGVWELDGVATK